MAMRKSLTTASTEIEAKKDPKPKVSGWTRKCSTAS